MLARSFWYDERWAGDVIEMVAWSGMTDDEREAAEVFKKKFEEKAKVANEGSELIEEEDDKYVEAQVEARWKECRAGCGAQDCKLVCSKCKEFRTSPLAGLHVFASFSLFRLQGTVHDNVKWRTGRYAFSRLT